MCLKLFEIFQTKKQTKNRIETGHRSPKIASDFTNSTLKVENFILQKLKLKKD